MGSVSSSRHTGCGDARVGHVGPRGRVDPVPARMVAGSRQPGGSGRDHPDDLCGQPAHCPGVRAPGLADARWPRLQIGLAIAGAWLVFAGTIAGNVGIAVAGSALALGGGVVFMANILALFRQPATLPAPPLPYPGQAEVDRVATRFMRMAGAYLVIGLGVGLIASVWRPETGRWDLVWAHAMLVGFFLSMASGVCYHVLSRWTGRNWGALMPIRLHVGIVALGLPVMPSPWPRITGGVFAIAGPLQAVAIGLFLVNIVPMVPALPDPTRPAFVAAALLLFAGSALGAMFAIEPAIGARLRLTHAEINLFGWTGLLISGAGYYLVPRFAGQLLRWPRLATVQLSALVVGVALAAVAFAWAHTATDRRRLCSSRKGWSAPASCSSGSRLPARFARRALVPLPRSCCDRRGDVSISNARWVSVGSLRLRGPPAASASMGVKFVSPRVRDWRGSDSPSTMRPAPPLCQIRR